MERWSLVVAVCLSVGCYEGPKSSGTEPWDESTEGSTGASNDDAPQTTTGPTTTTNPGSSSSASGPTSASDSSDPSSTSVGPGDESSDAGDSTTGEMTGCETGPLPAPIPGCTPTPPPSTGDIHQDCVDRINQFRWECQCLPPLMRWNAAEDCTDEQCSLDQNGGGPHGNFGMCGENAQNTCPNWGSEEQVITSCLQAMWDEGPGEPFSEHGHYINMSSTNYTRVACGFSSSGAGVWANQNFAP